jgi:hypothetical protein
MSNNSKIGKDENTFKTAAYCLKKKARGKASPSIFMY